VLSPAVLCLADSAFWRVATRPPGPVGARQHETCTSRRTKQQHTARESTWAWEQEQQQPRQGQGARPCRRRARDTLRKEAPTLTDHPKERPSDHLELMPAERRITCEWRSGWGSRRIGPSERAGARGRLVEAHC
jgi:hypothetical protein